MSWRFQQSTGQIADPGGNAAGSGYAGKGAGKNNPLMQDIRGGMRLINGVWQTVDGLTADDWGPLPCGFYTMQPPVDTTTHGPYVLWLSPDPENEMEGRSGMGIHGDSLEHPGNGSEGCICTRRSIRVGMWTGGDDRLQVVA